MAADFLDQPSAAFGTTIASDDCFSLGSLKRGGYPAGPPPNASADKCLGCHQRLA
jgi:hypothetical protein